MDSRSCGFYITAINADKHVPQDEQCGGLYCETTHFTCSSDYNITFSCTNTTYLDSNGNAQGVTLFVATDCDHNERLSLDQQDPRYDTIEEDQPVLAQLSLTAINETDQYDHNAYNDPSFYTTPDPPVLPTCLRGCLCGYSGYSDYSSSTNTLYNLCICKELLAYLFIYLQTLLPATFSPTVYTTPTNLSMLLDWDIGFDEFNTTLLYYGYVSWVNISEGSNLTLQKGFECFGDYETISEIMPL